MSAALQVSLQPQDLVNEHRDQWTKIWLKFKKEARAPWRKQTNLTLRVSWMPPRRKLNAHDVLIVSKCFKSRTALGGDDFHPRWFSLLPEDMRCQIAEFLNELEVIGWWPTQLRTTLIKLIPKAKGGKRPIGLLTALLRRWERLRIHEVLTW